MNPAPGRRVAVVGGGITGLATAYRLLTGPGAPGRNGHAIEVTVFEASPDLGGKVRTIDVGGLPVEGGADSFVVRKPEAVELCKELGLVDDLVTPEAGEAFVLVDGRLRSFPKPSAYGIPATAGALWRWRGLRRSARVRSSLDLVKPKRRGEDDESLGDLVARRMGRPVADVLVGPLLGGISAADPYRLSVLATFPELRDWEQRHGSLIRGARASLRALRPKDVPRERGVEYRPVLFAAPWGGLSELIDALEKWVDPARIRREAFVSSLRPAGSRFELEVGEERVSADAVALATPAFESARLLKEGNGLAAQALGTIPYVSTAVVTLVFPEGSAGWLPVGTGYVVPVSAQRTISACTWVSRKWPRPEFGDRAVVRCFVGRAGREEDLDRTDGELISGALGDVETVTPLGVSPEHASVVRWHRAMPQYEVGHLDRVRGVEEALEASPGVFVAGAAFRGVGIPDCIRDAGRAARAVEEFLGVAEPGEPGEDPAEPSTT